MKRFICWTAAAFLFFGGLAPIFANAQGVAALTVGSVIQNIEGLVRQLETSAQALIEQGNNSLGQQQICFDRAEVQKAFNYLQRSNFRREFGPVTLGQLYTPVQELLVQPNISFRLRTHGSPISANFSADGLRIITTRDETPRIWDAITGDNIMTLRGHERWVYYAAFSNDGSRVVTASEDETARIWDAAAGREIAILRGHVGKVLSAVFSSDGSKVVTAGQDKTARIWDVVSGREVTILRGHEQWLNFATFNSEGSRVVTASVDGTARIWDVTSGRELTALKISGPAISAGFSPDSSKIVTGSGDDTILVSDAASGRQLQSLRPPLPGGGVQSVEFSPDGTRLVAITPLHTTVWDVGKGSLIGILDDIESVAATILGNPSRLGIVSRDGSVRIWSLQ